jgi:hypothetical protein
MKQLILVIQKLRFVFIVYKIEVSLDKPYLLMRLTVSLGHSLH